MPTFTKLTPRSNAIKYRTSGTDTDSTCGLLSVNADLQYTHLPDVSAVIPGIDSSWSEVKARPLNIERELFGHKSLISVITPVPTPKGSLALPTVARSAFMKLDIYNLTDRSLLCHWNLNSPQEHCILLPNQPTNIKTPNRRAMMTLTAHQAINQRGQKDEVWLSTASFSPNSRSRALWTVMELDESAPWTIYRSRVSHGDDSVLDQLHNYISQGSRRHHTLLILPKRDPLSFLSGLSDHMSLSSLCLPGKSGHPTRLIIP